VRRHVTTISRAQRDVGERRGAMQRSDGGMQMSTVTVPFQLVVFCIRHVGHNLSNLGEENKYYSYIYANTLLP